MLEKVTRMNSSVAKMQLSEVIERVQHKGERFVIQKYNKDCVAVVPLSVLEESTKRASK